MLILLLDELCHGRTGLNASGRKGFQSFANLVNLHRYICEHLLTTHSLLAHRHRSYAMGFRG